MDPAEKEQRLIALVDQLQPRLQAAGVDSSNLADLATHSEWGIALDALIWAISEHALLIEPEQYQEIALLGTAMSMKPSTWQNLDKEGLVRAQVGKAPD